MHLLGVKTAFLFLSNINRTIKLLKLLLRMPPKKALLESSDIVLDDWQDCEEDEGDCTLPDPDIRYDLDQLKIFEAVPISLTYSDVEVMVEDNTEKRLSKELVKEKGHEKHEHVSQNLARRSLPQASEQTASILPKHAENIPEEDPQKSIHAKKSVEDYSPVIIFHDIFRSQIEWQMFAADVAYLIRKRTIVVDIRNHGTSPLISTRCGLGESLVDVRNLLRELKLPPCKVSVIGHKLSGWVLMAYCLLYPYKFKNLVVVEANPNVNPISSKDFISLKTALNLAQVPRSGAPLRAARFEVGLFLEEVLRNGKLRSYVVQNLVVEKVLGKPEKWDLRRTEILKSLSSFTKFPDFLRLFTFDKPTLFVASNNSRYIKKENEAEIMKLFPQAQFVYMKTASSNPHIDEFDNFVEHVTRFLNKHKLGG